MVRKWRVAVVHSDGASPRSPCALHNALYLALCLQLTDCADVTLVGATKYAAPTSQLRVLHPSTNEPTPARQSLDTDVIACLRALDADLHIFVAAPGDTRALATLFLEAVQGVDKRVLVFNVMRGVSEDTVLNDVLGQLKTLVIVNCHLGFDVLLRADVLTPFVTRGSLTLERLTKANLKDTDSAARLLESAKLNVQYKKGVPRYSWGVALFEHMYAVNGLAADTLTLRAAMNDRATRRLAAFLLHEAHECLVTVGKRGEWVPSIASMSYLEVYMLEALLLLPDPLFHLACRLGLLPPIPDLPTALQTDVANKRDLNTWNDDRLVKMADAYSLKMPLTRALHARIVEQGAARKGALDAVALRAFLASLQPLVPRDYGAYGLLVSKRVEFYGTRFLLAFLVLLLSMAIPYFGFI